MFDSIVISSRSAPGRDFRVGDLAEALLYYGKVHIVGNGGTIAGLVNSIGTLQLLELVERGYLSIHFETTMLAIRSPGGGEGTSGHEIQGFTPQVEVEVLIRRSLVTAGWDEYQAKIMAHRIAKRVERFSYPGYDPRTTTQLMLDPRVGQLIVPAYLRQFGADDAMPAAFEFAVLPEAGALSVRTNLDFQRATEHFRKAYNFKVEKVTPALVLDGVRLALDQELVGATLNSEVLGSDVVLAAGKVAMSRLIQRGTQSHNQIAAFEELTLDGASLAAVLTSGKRTFNDFLKVLKRAEQFRGWVADKQPDADLLREYHNAIAEKAFLESFPGKALRYFVFTGGGVAAEVSLGGGAGVVAGLASGAVDTFLLEKTRLGWKPHHFVTEDLRPFVKGAP